MATPASSRQLAPFGEVRIKWAFGMPLKDRRYGETECMQARDGTLCLVRMAGEPPTFKDVCGLARIGHEVAHALGGNH